MSLCSFEPNKKFLFLKNERSCCLNLSNGQNTPMFASVHEDENKLLFKGSENEGGGYRVF